MVCAAVSIDRRFGHVRKNSQICHVGCHKGSRAVVIQIKAGEIPDFQSTPPNIQPVTAEQFRQLIIPCYRSMLPIKQLKGARCIEVIGVKDHALFDTVYRDIDAFVKQGNLPMLINNTDGDETATRNRGIVAQAAVPRLLFCRCRRMVFIGGQKRYLVE